jgi:hypothetical protein
MKNKLISLLLVGTLSLGLMACGQKQEVVEDASAVETSTETPTEKPDTVIEVNTDEKVAQKEVSVDTFKSAVESLGGTITAETSQDNATIGNRTGKLDIVVGKIDGLTVKYFSGPVIKDSISYLENCISIDLIETYTNSSTVTIGDSESVVETQDYAELLSIEGGNGYTSKQYAGAGYKYKVSYAGIGSYVSAEGTDTDKTLMTQFFSALGVDISESTFDEEYLYNLRKGVFAEEESNIVTEESSDGEGEEGEESDIESTEESVEGATDGE